MAEPVKNYTALRFWFDVGQYVVTIAIGVYVWVSGRLSARAGELARARKEMGRMNERLRKLEIDMDHAIDHEDLRAVHERINAVGDLVANLSGKMDGVKGAVDMIQEHLLSDRSR